MRLDRRLFYGSLVSMLASVPCSAQSTEVARLERAADSLFGAKQYAQAMSAYESLAKRDSTNAKIWYQIGLSAANLGKYDRGAVAFARSAALVPNPNAIYNAGAMHARMNHADSAFAWLSRAMKTGFGNPALLQSDEDLASIRSDARFPALVAAAKPPTPCLNDPDFRRFDFWVGEWDVTTKGGAPVGKSSVQSVSGGCGLLENWTAGNGATGKSLNTYNGQTKQWMQFWVGQGGGLTEYTESEWHDRAVTFFSKPTGPKTAFQRLSFTPVNDSTVRQFGEISTDGGTTWQVGYDFYYHRRR
jgi:hypothetical protein